MITPAFLLNFTTAILDPRITFTRSGNTATVINSAGVISAINADLPRFDYDPVTLASKGLLIEEQRTNLLTYSQQMESNLGWSHVNIVPTGNAGIAPDGLNTATLALESAATGAHVVQRAALTPGVTYAMSCFIKAAGRNFALFSDGVSNGVSINLTTGVVSVAAGSVSNIASTTFAGGWWRVSFTVTAASAAFNLYSSVDGVLANRSYAGDVTKGIYLWGAQLEAASFVTSYIPTTTTALTRNADIATITGSNFTSLWNSVQGGTSTQATPSIVSGIRPLVQFDDGTANEIIALRGNTTNPELYIVDGGTPQAQLDAGTIAANTAYSLTGWWATNDCKARKDAGAVVTDTTATIPTVTQMRIGSDGTNYLNGTIATINYYDSFFGRPIYTRRKNKVFPSLL